MKITLPHNWSPRHYQHRLWNYMANGGKRAVVVWPRRAGKDDVALHATACAAMERKANFWHVLPMYSQARKAIWDSVNPETGLRRIDEAFPKEIRTFTREQEMMIGFANGSTWQVIGSDNYNALVGTSAAGMVFSEYALSDPAAYGYLAPILMANNGWAMFISTPRGRNHLHSLLEIAKTDDSWFWEKLTNDDTGVFSNDDLQKELMRLQAQHGEDYGRAIWLQEYFTSFDASVPGSYWGEFISKAENECRITKVDHDPQAVTNTAFDLGWTDDTSIWWYQIIAGEVRVIDYYESSGKDIPHYADVLMQKKKEHGLTYGTHFLPHDARARTLAAGGKSIQQQMNALQVGRCVIAPRLDHEEGIQAGRATLVKSWFDAERCKKGLDALRNYRREWDDERKAFSARPLHDWSSHAASAWRTLSLSWRHPKLRQPETPVEERMMRGSIQNQTMGELRKKLFERKRRERTEQLH